MAATRKAQQRPGGAAWKRASVQRRRKCAPCLGRASSHGAGHRRTLHLGHFLFFPSMLLSPHEITLCLLPLTEVVHTAGLFICGLDDVATRRICAQARMAATASTARSIISRWRAVGRSIASANFRQRQQAAAQRRAGGISGMALLRASATRMRASRTAHRGINRRGVGDKRKMA